jgi:hypothetical protein
MLYYNYLRMKGVAAYQPLWCKDAVPARDSAYSADEYAHGVTEATEYSSVVRQGRVIDSASAKILDLKRMAAKEFDQVNKK